MISTLVEFIILLVRMLLVVVQTIFGLLLPDKRKDISGQVVLITGSAMGIGKEMVLRLHKLGANLALVDINEVCASSN